MDAQTRDSDRAVGGILASNAFTLGAALWQDWGVLQLMWPFWIQSLVIGWYARKRILKLGAFSTDGLTMNDRPVPPTPASQRGVANFFALHYGGFHLGYLVFLVLMTTTSDAAGFITVTNESTGVRSLVEVGRVHPFDFAIFAALGIGFWQTHRASHREHVAADLGQSPNLGTLMFMPYARIVPMHLTLVFGFMLDTGALWLFVLLKTSADVVMHKLEHRMLGAAPRRRETLPGH